ncbi:MAG: lytic transglycosylase domain-containing protein [Sphingomonadales bacterium]|nr:MAG: lytic transglycosylase domain-containing protein [Sphingomonadales bacterium]
MKLRNPNLRARAVQAASRLALAVCALAATLPAHALDAAQTAWYRARFAAIAAGRLDQTPASSPAPNLPDPLAEALVRWAELRAADKPTFETLATFLLANPGWPQEQTLRRKAEAAISPETPVELQRQYFARMPAVSPTGRAWQALAEPQPDKAQALARAAWVSSGLGPEDEDRLLARFSFSPEAHDARANALLWAGRVSRATRLLGLLAPDRRAVAEARIALIQSQTDATAKYGRLPVEARAQTAVVYDLARYFRRAQQNAALARQTLLQARLSEAEILDERGWAKELLLLADQAQDSGLHDEAYRLLAADPLHASTRSVAQMPLDERVAATDIAWRAGWIALNDLKRPADAMRAFDAVFRIGQHPVTQSRAAYWAGRAAEASGDAALAQRWYQQAAQFPGSFYGQLAADRGRIPVAAVTIAAPPPGDAARQAFLAEPLVRAAQVLSELGQERLESVFVRHLADGARTLERRQLVASLAQTLDAPEAGVLIARQPGARSIFTEQAGYPKLALDTDLTPASVMIHAIARQESHFNALAVSSAGARGLMQLMPATARETAGKLGLTYDPTALTREPLYNLRLGNSYFQRMLDNYDGNHVMAVAAYNAGPGRVRQWVQRFGDPRDPNVDILQWIEKIPIPETRDYVQRVLENAVVYASRQGSGTAAVRPSLIWRFLDRGDKGATN